MNSDKQTPERTCAICGRLGTRQFRVMQTRLPAPPGFLTEPYTVCTNRQACVRRKHEVSP